MFCRYLSIIAVLLAFTNAVLGDGRCANGGLEGDGNHVKCTCKHGFKGFDCSQRVTPCEGQPCRNGGKCVELKGGTFRCQCSSYFKGVICEQKVRPCDSGPCKNGGTCTNDGIKCFKCKCPTGFKGSDCSQIVKPCEIKPCGNGGTCINEGHGRFRCECKEGFGGTFCDRRDGLYGSKILRGQTKYIKQLDKWLGGVKFAKLCYRATDHGWTAAKFHANCDYKEPIVTIIRVGKYIFGAYSDKPFGGNTRYLASTNGFIFSLVNKDNLAPFKSPVYQNSGHAIYTNAGYGPTFGGGHDIYISNIANTNANSLTQLGYTYKPPNGYKYNTPKTQALLAGTYKFTPSEVEIFWLY